MRQILLQIAATYTLLALTFITETTAMPTQRTDGLSIVPAPFLVQRHPGEFLLTKNTALSYAASQAGAREVAEYLASLLRMSTGLPLPVRASSRTAGANAIDFQLVTDLSLGPEGYALEVTTKGATIRGNAPAGLFYGAQTVLQLLPAKAYSEKPVRNVRWNIPSVTVRDTPRFGWRGMMLDVSRHFFPKEFVKKFIDLLALHKLNTFHWHLCDDQGWRIEIKRYPKLIQKSAWRADRLELHWNARPEQQAGEPATYGGFYTQEDIREIVRYAGERYITVVPEIEMPAHCTAVLAAYPELSCTGGPFTVPTGGLWPIKDIYCAGNDSVFVFLENVLAEVIPLFPESYVHIGGDEANKTEWKRCPKCQARISKEGLKDEAELQSYFIKRMEKVLKSMNKRLIGWDEILEGGLAPDATVMSWRGTAGGIIAARERHDVVMTPTTFCYLDYYQADPSIEPIAIGGSLPLQTVYSFEPTVDDSLTVEETKHILGVQANVWTEYISSPAKAEYMMFPRIAAVAEVGWSSREKRIWEDFTRRLDRQFERYASRGINAAKSFYAVSMADSFDPAIGKRAITLNAQIGPALIRYTVDGKRPGPNSRAYRSPIILSRGALVQAATFKNGRMRGPVTSVRYPVSLPGEKVVTLTTPFDDRFGKGGGEALVDGSLAQAVSKDKRWRGIRGTDFEATLDFGRVRKIQRIGMSFLHETTSSIFPPSEVQISFSADGKEFPTMATLKSEALQKEPRAFKKGFDAIVKNVKARYVRVTAKNAGPAPEWHKRAGEPTSMFLDEISVE